MLHPIFANLLAFDNPIALAIIAAVVVLLFGGNKLAGFGKSLGEGLKEFKKAVKDESADDKGAALLKDSSENKPATAKLEVVASKPEETVKKD